MDFTLGLVTGMYAIVAVIVFYVVYVIEVKLGMPSMLLLDNNSTQFNSIHLLTHFLHTHHMPPLATLAATFHFSIVHRRFVFLTIVLTIRLAVVFLDKTVARANVAPFSCMLSDLPAIVNGLNNNNNNNNNSNSNNNNELNGDSQLADLSQTRLRNLIESIIAETLRSSSGNALSPSAAVSEISLDTRSNGQLSVLSNGSKRRHRTEHYFEPKIYQDLLATAVLNKVRQTRDGSNCCMWHVQQGNLAANHFDPQPCNPCGNFRFAFPFIIRTSWASNVTQSLHSDSCH